MMSLEEALAQGVTEETFSAMDADGNGQVAKEEFQACHPERTLIRSTPTMFSSRSLVAKGIIH